MENIINKLFDFSWESIKVKINNLLMVIFLFFSIFTPADKYGLKLIFFIALLLFNFYLITTSLCNSKFWDIGFHVTIFPFLLFVLSIVNGGDLVITISNIYLCLIPSLIIIIFYNNINFDKFFMLILFIMVIIILVSFILDFIGMVDIYSNKLLMYMYLNSDAMIGKSNLYWSYYVFFFKTSPLIFFLLGFLLNKKKYLLSGLSVIALLLTGTRANFFMVFILLLFYVFNFLKSKSFIKKILSYMFLVVIILFFFNTTYSFIKVMFDMKIGSDLNKLEDFIEIYTLFKKYPLTILMGTGFGSENLYNLVNTTSELALFDLWRKIGLFGLVMFLYFIFKPVKLLWININMRWLIYSYFAYLLVAMTNPLLFSSTAYIAYVYVYTKYYELKYDVLFN